MATASNKTSVLYNGETKQINFSTSIRKLPANDDDDDDESLDMILEKQPYLYDLHTHLLGMGNTGFWIDSIIEKPQILPPHVDFCHNPKLREQLCPLIWNNGEKNGGAFINGKQTAMFFDYLIEKNFPKCHVEDILSCLDNIEDGHISAFRQLITDETFTRELAHYNLFFGRVNSNAKTRSADGNPIKHDIIGDFTYDIVLTLSDLSKALGVSISWKSEFEDLIQSKVEEKLGLHTYHQSSEVPSRPFRRWIIFNARSQCFNVVKGITVETLRRLIAVNANAPAQECTLARAHIQNAFSMRNPDGTDPRPIDFDKFHGAFTPEFYPRRFALKDSIYSQRLDILAALLLHILRRYQTCLPPVRYCELSIGVGDLSRPWVFDVLRSFPAYDPVNDNRQMVSETTSFRRMIQNGHFLHLRNACPRADEPDENKLSCVPNVTYKFLAGFNRQTVVEDRLSNQEEALRLLNDSPDVAIHYMLEQLVKSENEEEFATKQKAPQVHSEKKTRDRLFARSLQDLEKMQDVAGKIPSFYHWVVGLDLFGDEMGYPYCPFVAWPFIEYIRERRKENEKFGLRIHCGENVPFADIDAGAYRHFIAHMYIVFRCLRFLYRKLRRNIRIGHGVAFARILGEGMKKSTNRKSSVLLAEMQDHAKHFFPKFVFEINITSNEYLLGQAIREGNLQQIIRLKPLTDIEIPIILATDDDGVWPIDHCPAKHPGHQSLVAEYCRAFSLSLITEAKDLRRMIADTARSCFYSPNGEHSSDTCDHENNLFYNDNKNASTIVFHPDLPKTILQKCVTNECTEVSIFKYYSKLYPHGSWQLCKKEETWIRKCNNLSRFVFFSYYNVISTTPLDEYSDEYEKIFGDDHSFHKIRNIWLEVWNRFMDNGVKDRGNYIDIGSKELVFLSESSHEKNQDLSHLIEELGSNRLNGRHVRVFTRQILNPPETIPRLNKSIERYSSAKSITVFTTKNKDECLGYGSTERSRVKINENPTRRTNYQGLPEEHVLYVICRHAAAATAYLHHIENQISVPNGQMLPHLQEQPSVIYDVREQHPTTESSANIGAQPNDIIFEQVSDEYD